MKKIKIKFYTEKIKKILSFFAKYRYILFILFICLSLTFTFKVIFDNAYTNITFINYKENESDVILEAKKINNRLQVIMVNIKERKNKFENKVDLKYVNPFKYNVSEIEIENIDLENNEDFIKDETIEVSRDF
ncbi:MAG: hypothetical protein KAI57_01580 [Candidatus Pacebacteria bacterium]|nr:hypothetical protein [Candidatus Paceibacterota bacterium]